MLKRISALLLCVCITFSCLIVPSSALGFDFEVSLPEISSFYDWCLGKRALSENWFWSHLNDDVCRASTGFDGLHNFVQKHTQVGGKPGMYYVCEYCGKSAGEVGNDVYNSQVSDIESAYGSTVVGSNGLARYYITNWNYSPYYTDVIFSLSERPYFQGSRTYYQIGVSFTLSALFSVPYSGSYRIVFPEPSFDGSYNSSNGSVPTWCLDGGSYSSRGFGTFTTGWSSAVALSSGQNYKVYTSSGTRVFLTPPSGSAVATYDGGRPYVELQQVTGDGPSLSLDVSSRSSSVTGDFGIIGDNGQITKVEGNTIVNETNNTIYNPATGETHTMSDWSYNYTDRSYTATSETGDTINVTYGDEYVTIKEGDTIYTIYYIIEGSGSGSGETPDPGPGTDPDPGPGEDACNHHWTETSVTSATCTVPGSRLLTCSLCGETRTETIPAPGHTWVIKQSVNTEYDDKGNLIQEGYTIYECSVCGEQYKTTDGSSPPGSGFGETSGIFSGIFGLLLDFLSFFWNTFRQFVGEGVKGFLEGLRDGTSAFFGLLNPFNWGD